MFVDSIPKISQNFIQFEFHIIKLQFPFQFTLSLASPSQI
jgi:hypothetical protein